MDHVSSHWRSMLQGFDGTPQGLRGVSHLSPRSRNLLHWFFERRFVAMGDGLKHFSLYLRAGRAVAKRQRRAFDLNMLRQCLTLALCDQHGALKPDGEFVIIGDGYAALSSALVEAHPNCRVTLLNIAPVLEIDRLYFRTAHPDKSATFVASENLAAMPRANLSFDVACMQEINPDVRNQYFSTLRQRVEFTYSCNRVSKTFPDGTVTNFADYPWGGTLLVDELCPWHQQFYSFRPPIWRRFDGPTMHRLVRW